MMQQTEVRRCTVAVDSPLVRTGGGEVEPISADRAVPVPLVPELILRHLVLCLYGLWQDAALCESKGRIEGAPCGMKSKPAAWLCVLMVPAFMLCESTAFVHGKMAFVPSKDGVCWTPSSRHEAPAPGAPAASSSRPSSTVRMASSAMLSVTETGGPSEGASLSDGSFRPYGWLNRGWREVAIVLLNAALLTCIRKRLLPIALFKQLRSPVARAVVSLLSTALEFAVYASPLLQVGRISCSPVIHMRGRSDG